MIFAHRNTCFCAYTSPYRCKSLRSGTWSKPGVGVAVARRIDISLILSVGWSSSSTIYMGKFCYFICWQWTGQTDWWPSVSRVHRQLGCHFRRPWRFRAQSLDSKASGAKTSMLLVREYAKPITRASFYDEIEYIYDRTCIFGKI